MDHEFKHETIQLLEEKRGKIHQVLKKRILILGTKNMIHIKENKPDIIKIINTGPVKDLVKMKR